MDTGDFMIGVEVLAFLKDWLTNHIMKSDMAYSDFLVSKGVS
jgi:hemerythrin